MLVNLAANPEQTARADRDLWTGISEQLSRGNIGRALQGGALALEVHDGVAFIFGHVASTTMRHEAGRLVARLRGVKAVHNTIVADSDLVTDVAQALAGDLRTRPFVLRVSAVSGWIRLGGNVPDAATRALAERVAASVPAVRGVLLLPDLPAGSARVEQSRRPLQPRLGSSVYARSDVAGQVTAVVIHPDSRLVSHIVVDLAPANDWRHDYTFASADMPDASRPALLQRVVPVKSIALANESGVSLSGNLSSLFAQPVYRAADFPLAPATWQPPFPYGPGTVRWPAEC